MLFRVIHVNRVILGYFGLFWVILGYFGLFWVISMIYHAEAYTGYFGISNIFQSIIVIFRVIFVFRVISGLAKKTYKTCNFGLFT